MSFVCHWKPNVNTQVDNINYWQYKSAIKILSKTVNESTDSNYLFHWSLDVTESIGLKEGNITETLMDSCPNSYLI